EELEAIIQTQDGGYILGGHSTSGIGGDKSGIVHGGFDYWLVKLDANGVKIWDKGFGCGENDVLNSVKITKQGDLMLGGYTYLDAFGCPRAGLSKGLFDYSIMKTNSSGNKRCETILGGTDRDFLNSIQITSDSGV